MVADQRAIYLWNANWNHRPTLYTAEEVSEIVEEARVEGAALMAHKLEEDSKRLETFPALEQEFAEEICATLPDWKAK